MALAADDLLQEVRIRVWETCQRDNNSSFNTSYYMRVVNSAIIDSLRKHRGTLAHSVRAYGNEEQDMLAELGADEPGPEQLLDHALQRLPKARAQAVALYLQGYNAEEIAGLMKCDRHRAHNLAYRGVRELKQLLLAEVDANEVDEQQNVRDDRQ
jgi:RNA polymerase sigma factor (sigma-70 family)